MYELLVLKIPFDGEGSAAGVANIKGHVLSGGRPPISNKVRQCYHIFFFISVHIIYYTFSKYFLMHIANDEPSDKLTMVKATLFNFSVLD